MASPQRGAGNLTKIGSKIYQKSICLRKNFFHVLLMSSSLPCLHSARLSFVKPSDTDGWSAYCRAEPGLHELSREGSRQDEVRQTTDGLHCV